jgi:hypothetical protein
MPVQKERQRQPGAVMPAMLVDRWRWAKKRSSRSVLKMLMSVGRA